MSSSSIRTYIVIPAYNEAKIIGSVVRNVKNKGYDNIIIIDDGSIDDTAGKARQAGAVALKHKLNRGKGAATKTGIEAAKILGADIIVTMDGDGQHDPEDIQKLIDPIVNNTCDVTLGTRLKDTKGMPYHKIAANHIANFITWLLYGLWVTDSQSGFRGYSKNALNVINTKADTYEYDSEIIREIYTYRLRYREIPIKVLYTEYSMGKTHKQTLVNGLKTMYKMLWNKIQ